MPWKSCDPNGWRSAMWSDARDPAGHARLRLATTASALGKKRHWCRAIGIQLVDLTRPALLVEQQQADTRAVPYPFTGVTAVRHARYDSIGRASCRERVWQNEEI